jgi:hypothetical protein
MREFVSLGGFGVPHLAQQSGWYWTIQDEIAIEQFHCKLLRFPSLQSGHFAPVVDRWIILIFWLQLWIWPIRIVWLQNWPLVVILIGLSRVSVLVYGVVSLGFGSVGLLVVGIVVTLGRYRVIIVT